MEHKKSYRPLILLLLLVGNNCFVSKSYSQRISFSTWTGSEEIMITSVIASPTLNFNQKQANIIQNSPAISINLNDIAAIAFAIEAPENFDLTVEVDAPTVLALDSDPSKTIPFQIKMAYNNLRAVDENSGKASAIELPSGFYNVTFPVNRRTSGAPGPPPTPLSGSETRTKAKAFVYLYGVLGPIGVIPAGNYTGIINLNVFITSYD
jgi:hypothetical protein